MSGRSGAWSMRWPPCACPLMLRTSRPLCRRSPGARCRRSLLTTRRSFGSSAGTSCTGTRPRDQRPPTSSSGAMCRTKFAACCWRSVPRRAWEHQPPTTVRLRRRLRRPRRQVPAPLGGRPRIAPRTPRRGSMPRPRSSSSRSPPPGRSSIRAGAGRLERTGGTEGDPVSAPTFASPALRAGQPSSSSCACRLGEGLSPAKSA
mmetsp:Transcript_83967/g.216116  ORF Transcript_83967/g.216116 Transcript_83967/m.216116 type:complete len:203 (+) Transcript_83967:698-1306(+)